MTRAELSSFPTEKLIDLLLDLQDANGRLRAENARLGARVEEPEARLRRPPKTPKNSSVPPSAGRKGSRRRSPGRRSKGK
ncbi:MAG TPA: hypothetical protein EYP77_01315 [Anaerolineae bacterium]|nr:hypothetical protein [Anaerolineae bacterium]